MKKKNIINKLIVAPLVMGFMSCTGTVSYTHLTLPTILLV